MASLAALLELPDQLAQLQRRVTELAERTPADMITAPATVLRLTAALIAEIEAQRWKKLIPEALEKVKTLAGEALKVTQVKSIVGQSEAENGCEVRGFNLFQGRIFRAGPAAAGASGLFVFANTFNIETNVAEVDNFEPAHLSNVAPILETVGSVTFTGWKLTGLTPKQSEAAPLLIVNNSGAGVTVTLTNESAKSEPANRFVMAAASLVLQPGQGALFVYLNERWRLIAHT